LDRSVAADQLRSVRAARSVSGALASIGALSVGLVEPLGEPLGEPLVVPLFAPLVDELVDGCGMVDASIDGATYFESGSAPPDVAGEFVVPDESVVPDEPDALGEDVVPDEFEVPGELLLSLVDCA
jgi:hypothetical protein